MQAIRPARAAVPLDDGLVPASAARRLLDDGRIREGSGTGGCGSLLWLQRYDSPVGTEEREGRMRLLRRTDATEGDIAMTETTFNAYEVLKIATEMERDGITFYEALAGAARSEQIKRLAADLADQERDHIQRFEQMINAERFDNAWDQDNLQLLDDYLNATVKRGIFTGRKAARKIAEYVSNLGEALSLAIHMERMTVKYYEKLHDTCTYDTGRKAFAQLVEEERKHAARLEEARASLDVD